MWVASAHLAAVESARGPWKKTTIDLLHENALGGMGLFKPGARRALTHGILAALGLLALIVWGSGHLREFDAALVPYTAATIFATFAIVYRYTIWLQRPATRLYWAKGWRYFLRPRILGRNLLRFGQLVVADLLTQRFIGRRSRLRWVAHLLISWGCMLAFAVTFPLVWGWIHFESVSGTEMSYDIYLFSASVLTLPIDHPVMWLFFNALNISAVMVLAGIALAFVRRLQDPGAMAVQQFPNDMVPLLMLVAISATGLMLTVSARFMHGAQYQFISITHAITVIHFLLYLPFGKFFHIFQRPAQLGVAYYKEAGEREGPATCPRCGTAFTSALHLRDLKGLMNELGFAYDEHHTLCPACRRKLLAFSQRTLLAARAADEK